MLGFVWSQFRGRRARIAALGLAIVVAAVSFILLTASAQTSSLHVQGTLRSNFRAAYDILVRPPGSQTSLERHQRLVRPNYLSGIFGGITLAQWRHVLATPGVDVAAPIANVGYLLPFASIELPLKRVLTAAPFQLYRIRFSYVGDRGTSSYPSGTEYVYFTPRDRFVLSRTEGIQELPAGGAPVPICTTAFNKGNPTLSIASPFARVSYLSCFSARSPGQGSDSFDCRPCAGHVSAEWSLSFPILVAAIDPEQENRLLHLGRTIVSGRGLLDTDGPRLVWNSTHDERFRVVPVIASTRTFVDQRLQAIVERLRVPPGLLPRALGASDGYRRISRLTGSRVARLSVSAGAAFRQLLRGARTVPNSLGTGLYWTTSTVRYRGDPTRSIAPLPTTNPFSVWSTPFEGTSGGYWPAPPANADTQFRRLTPHAEDNHIPYGVANGAELRLVGRFDPAKLPGFSPLSRVPLETFYPPQLEPADTASRAALHGQPLLPDENVGGYISQPPLLLTTLAGLKPFYNPRFYSNVRGHRRAPISVIQVRVKGVTGPDELSLERVRLVAQRIHDETGLAVDITTGSSPHPLLVDLPAGKFGRPQLLLREGWSKKGVTVSFLRALDRKDLLLFALILPVCALFLANGALAAVRTRRAEIGTLLTLGWPRSAVFRAVLGELALVGVGAGLLATGIAAVLVVALGLHSSLATTLLVLPISVGLALVAGLVPAWLAAEGAPLDAVRAPVSSVGRRRSARGVAALALLNLGRVPSRTLLGAAGLFVGVAALTVLLAIERSFHGAVVGTLLGQAVAVQARGADFAAVGLTIALAGVSIADVLYVNVRERAAELATLRAIGWSGPSVARVVIVEGIALGAIGAIAGALAGIAFGTALLGTSASLVAAAGLAAAGGMAVTALATLAPVGLLATATPARLLAAE
jgi:hypothetical protein